MIEYLPRSKQHTELYLTQFGTEDCVPGHKFGPAVRTHYLLHYVFGGTGMFEAHGVEYPIQPGQGFLICPHDVTSYQADSDEPWSYGWIGFNGTLADTLLEQAGLTASSPVFRCSQAEAIRQILQDMARPSADRRARESRLTGLLHLMLSLLIESGTQAPLPPAISRTEAYVEQVKDFIEMNFAHKFSIEDIARLIGLNRSYLCALFTQTTGMSIQDYLIGYRIDRASQLLLNTDLSIGNIARSVGYVDPLLFSKVFKKVKGRSPKLYRSELMAKSNEEG